MFTITFAVSAIATAAFVQAGNPLIPSGISTGCTAFLNQLDADSTITSCTAPLIAATSAFAPGAPAASSSAITNAVSSICSSSSPGCDATYVRSQLTAFYAACSDELTGATPSKSVLSTYDVLYALVPLTQSICSQDDSGASCVSSTLAAASSKRELVERGTAAQTPVLAVNTTTFRANNLAFLYLSPSTPKTTLCKTCTRKILTSYIAFETSLPYAASLVNSPTLGGQGELYSAVLEQCGSDFVTGSVQAAAGSLSGDGLSGGAVVGRPINGLVAAALALFVGAFAL